MILILIFSLPKLVKINQIFCLNQYGNCGDYFLLKIKDFEGQSLFNSKKSLTKYLTNEPSIEEFSLVYKFPDKIQAMIIEKKAKFALKDINQNFYVLIDENGLVLRIQNSSTLPYVITDEMFKNVGEKVSSKEKFALDLIYDFSITYQLHLGIIKNDSLTVELPKGLQLIFPLEGDKTLLLSSLNAILERLNTGAKDTKIEKAKIVKSIDLRFKNPIIKYY